MGHESIKKRVVGYDEKYYRVNWLSAAQTLTVALNIVFIVVTLTGLFSDNEVVRHWWGWGIFGHVVAGGLITFFWQGYSLYMYNYDTAPDMSENHNSAIWMGFGASWAALALNVGLLFAWLVKYGPSVNGNLTTAVVDLTGVIGAPEIRYVALLVIMFLLSAISAVYEVGALKAHRMPEAKLTSYE